MRIGLDIDGVLYRYVESITRWCQTRYENQEGFNFSAPVTKWYFFEDWLHGGETMTGPQLGQEMEDACNAGHLYYDEPIDPAWIETLGAFINAGHTIHLITARAETGGPYATVQWLKDNKVPYDSLHFAKDKSLVNVDVLVDDRDKNIQEWIEATGKPGIIYDQPWNRDLHDWVTTSGVWRGFSPEHVGDIVAWITVDKATMMPGTTPITNVNTIEETALQEAQRLVHGARGADYGHPIDDFGRTAAIWSALFQGILVPDVTFEPQDVALAMIAVKMSREVNKPKRDNRVDMAGYAETLQMVWDEKDRRALEGIS